MAVLKFRLIGEAPLITHNGALANPANPYAKEMKKISGKRQKTEADFHALAKLEFMGGLYQDKTHGVILPGDLVEAAMVKGAMKFKEGPLAKAGAFVTKHFPLEFEGPQTPEEMWEDGRFTFQKMVTVQRNKILRTRPIFEEWSAVVEINVEEDVVTPSRVYDWLEKAGTVIGIGDWRPRYGRFSVEQLNGA